MRKLITRSVLTVFAVLVLASQASAAPIAVGWLQWFNTEFDAQGVPTAGQFSVVNQTGANYLGDPAFPVVTQLLFNADLTLTVEPGATALTPGAGLNLSALDSISYDSDPLAPGPTMATLTGTVSPLLAMIDLDGGGAGGASLWNILGGLTDIAGNPVVLGDGVNPIADGALAVLYVNAEPVRVVPEPMTVLLLGAGGIGLAVRRRLAARR